jgi:hypothetical protein
MKLSEEQFLFLIQVLKESIEVDPRFDYVFSNAKLERKRFYKQLVATQPAEILLKIDL